MLRAYSNNLTVSANNAIPFNTNKLANSRGITHSAGSSQFVVISPGYYDIVVDVSMTVTATTPVQIQLYADGVAIPDALINVTVSEDADTQASFTTTIAAKPAPTKTTVILTIVTDADITINSISIGTNEVNALS